MKNSVLIALLSLCVTFSSTQVEARKGLGSLFKLGRGAKSINGVKHYNSGTLTVEQLKDCLLLEQRVDTSDNMLGAKQSSIKYQQQKLKQLELEISILRISLNANRSTQFYAQEQVDKYNLEIERYNQFVHAHNIQLELYKLSESNYNDAVGEHNKLIDYFQISCAGKRYYEEDLVLAKSLLAR